MHPLTPIETHVCTLTNRLLSNASRGSMAIISSHYYGIMVLEFEAKTSLKTDWREYETGNYIRHRHKIQQFTPE